MSSSCRTPSASTGPMREADEDAVYEKVNTLGPDGLCGMRVDDMLGAGCPHSPHYKAVTNLLRENSPIVNGRKRNPVWPPPAPGTVRGKDEAISFSTGRRMSEHLLDQEITSSRPFRLHRTCSVRHPCSPAKSQRPPCRRCANAPVSCSSLKRTRT